MFKHIQNPFQFKFQDQDPKFQDQIRRCDPIVDRLRSDRPIGEILDEKKSCCRMENMLALSGGCSLCVQGVLNVIYK